jgi:hypothetical protein
MCVLYGPQNKQRLLPHTKLIDWFCITEVESVYCAERAESLYKTDKFRLYRVSRIMKIKGFADILLGRIFGPTRNEAKGTRENACQRT